MLAGELDDRWPSCASGWAGGKSGHRIRASGVGNAPGNARGLATQVSPQDEISRFGVWRRVSPGAVRLSYGQCHREYTASNVQPGDSPKENLRDIFAWCACRQG
jgi:hypothetical protein